MRKRDIRVQVWLNETENTKLQTDLERTGLSRECYLRTLINGYSPKFLPPLDYYTLIKELHAIGNNLNQIAAKAHATGYLDKTSFQYEANRLRKAVLEIQAAFTLPERRSVNGDNGNMRCGPT